MKNFIGRERELAQLNETFSKEGFQMAVVYGRRRVGKTTLLNKFSEGKKTVFYTAIETGNEMNQEQFGNMVFHFFSGSHAELHFRSYEEIFAYITDCLKKEEWNREKMVLVIDEYPYLAGADKGLSSVLQRWIDREWNRLNMFLILCGSSISFMEEEVLGSKSPLYGRRTMQMDIRPFDYKTSALFVPDYSAEDKAVMYGITGGIPKYLSVMDPSIPLGDNIKRQFFRDDGYLYEEPQNLLRQEFRNIALYNSIIEAVAHGAVQMNEIAARTVLDTSAIAQAAAKLISVRILKKDTPILNEKNKRYTQYVIRDGMFRFWYRFVPGATGAVERGFGNEYYDQAVAPFLHEYMGGIFEEMCQEYVFMNGLSGKYGDIITNVGKWRGMDNLKKEPADIDVVGINTMNKKAVIGECKFRNSRFGSEEEKKLIDRARLIYPYTAIHFVLFSVGGFTEEVLEGAEDRKVNCVRLEDMYGV